VPELPATDAGGRRTVLVTGGGTGIGRESALAFGRAGYRVAVAGRRRSPLEDTVGQLGDGLAVCGDHCEERDAERMVAETVQAFGRLDVLVNNAGAIRRDVPVHELSSRRWDDQVATNLRGPFLMARAALRAMLADLSVPSAGQAGSADRAVVNVSSTLAHSASPGVAAYSAAKAGVLALTRSIAVEYGRYGIRCNAVCPHVVDTALARTDRPEWSRFRTEVTAAYPLGRIGAPADVAGAIVYLASPAAAWVSGTSLDVDGGITA
jgi:NAD(P)-dependent dehydrogenase (short-subunit alcohol dehydrogenase family)